MVVAEVASRKTPGRDSLAHSVSAASICALPATSDSIKQSPTQVSSATESTLLRTCTPAAHSGPGPGAIFGTVVTPVAGSFRACVPTRGALASASASLSSIATTCPAEAHRDDAFAADSWTDTDDAFVPGSWTGTDDTFGPGAARAAEGDEEAFDAARAADRWTFSD